MKNKKIMYKSGQKNIEKYCSWTKFECEFCGNQNVFFYHKYDAICCLSCDAWFSSCCQDPNCPYCSNRPSTPSQALNFELKKDISNKDWRRQNYQHKNNGNLRHIRRKLLYNKKENAYYI